MKLAAVLPELTRELSEGLRELGHQELATSIADVTVVDRCTCEDPGCVTFYAVPKADAPSWPDCERIIAPAPGVICVHYKGSTVLWVEVLGRPQDRNTLDGLEEDLEVR